MAFVALPNTDPHIVPGAPRRGGTVVGGGGGGWLLVLVDRVEQVVDLPRGSRGEQPVDLLGVAEHHRDLAQDLQMPVVHPRDPDREPDLVAVPSRSGSHTAPPTVRTSRSCPS